MWQVIALIQVYRCRESKPVIPPVFAKQTPEITTYASAFVYTEFSILWVFYHCFWYFAMC